MFISVCVCVCVCMCVCVCVCVCMCVCVNMYVCMYVCIGIGNVLFNDALDTFYLRLYGVRHMVMDDSDSEKRNVAT